MYSYIRTMLMDGESVLHVARLHWIIYIDGLFITILAWALALVGPDTLLFKLTGFHLPPALAHIANIITFGFVIVGCFLLLRAYVRQITTELAVTNRRVLAKFGVISRTTFELFLNKVEGANVDQGILGRLLGFGSIHVKGTGGGLSPIDSIYAPHMFQRVLLTKISEVQEHLAGTPAGQHEVADND